MLFRSGLSSHMSIPFENKVSIVPEEIDNYLASIDKLKVEYKDVIKIYKSLEIDYLMDRQAISQASKEVMEKLDYVIMSIHLMGSISKNEPYYIDKSPEDFQTGIEKLYGGDIKAFIKDYYRSIALMVKTYKPDIVGHLDLIKKFNGNNVLFNDGEEWYRYAVCNCLDQIAETNSMIEINTGANIRRPGVGRYPSDWIIPEMKKRSIPITIGADSHSTGGIAAEYQEAEDYLLKCGYDTYQIFKNGGWEACSF